jgi:hypothetical protein
MNIACFCGARLSGPWTPVCPRCGARLPEPTVRAVDREPQPVDQPKMWLHDTATGQGRWVSPDGAR